jgi:mannose-6-phosphate isomerase-like protein (cupin superfamily)
MLRMTAHGEGWTTTTLADLGDGPGFRKVRKELGVEAFGVNAIVIPAGYETGFNWHEKQDELYFVHAGRILMTFGDGGTQELEAGGFAHVSAPTHRKVKNIGDSEAIYIIVGAKGGYVGRDGRSDDTARVQPSS